MTRLNSTSSGVIAAKPVDPGSIPEDKPSKRFTTKYYHWLLLLVLGFLWGSSFTVNARLVEYIPPVASVFLRLSIAAVCLNLFVFFAPPPPTKTRPRWQLSFATALFMCAIPFMLIVWAQQYIASGVASIVNAFTPVATLVIAQLLAPIDKFSLPRLLAILFGLGGVSVMIGWEWLVGDSDQIFPMLTILAATLCYALSATLVFRWHRDTTSTMLVCRNQFSLATLFVLPFLLTYDTHWVSIFLATPELWLLALWIGLASTAAAYVLFYFLIKQIGPTNASMVTFIAPGAAILLGVTLLGETLDVNHIIGIAMIFLALYYTHRLHS